MDYIATDSTYCWFLFFTWTADAENTYLPMPIVHFFQDRFSFDSLEIEERLRVWKSSFMANTIYEALPFFIFHLPSQLTFQLEIFCSEYTKLIYEIAVAEIVFYFSVIS